MLPSTRGEPRPGGLSNGPSRHHTALPSGKPLKGNFKVHYRSELYVAEQRANVLAAQDSLKEALEELELSGGENLAYHTERIEFLKRMCEQMILVFQICKKIETELTYAQKDLRNAIRRNQDSKAIGACRKRVQWLEDRLGILVSKHSPERKYDSSPDQSMGGSAFSLRGSGVGMSESSVALAGRSVGSFGQVMRSTGSATISRKSPDKLELNKRTKISDSPGSKVLKPKSSLKASKKSVSEKGCDGQRLSEKRKSEKLGVSLSQSKQSLGVLPSDGGTSKQSLGVLPSDGGTSVKGQSETDVQSYQGSMEPKPSFLTGNSMLENWDGFRFHGQDSGVEPLLPPLESTMSFPASAAMSQSSFLDRLSGDRGSAGSQPTVPSSDRGLFSKPEDESSSQKVESVEGDMESGSAAEFKHSATPEDEKTDFDGDEEETFTANQERPLTQVKSEGRSSKFTTVTYAEESPRGKLLTAQRSRASRVTLRTPVEETQSLHPHHDLDHMHHAPSRPHPADTYWQSEHHRFEYSTLAPVLDSLDPNSLHQIGLAKPGTYIQPLSPSNQPSLPWLVPDEDTPDIHRHRQRQQRIALDLLEVRIHQMYSQIYSAAMLSVMGAEGTNKLKKDGNQMMDRPSSQAHGDDEDLVTRTPVPPTVFHPLPLPLPPSVPMKKLNRQELYPRPIADFIGADQEEHMCPPRLVNQGNLYDETKMTIYKPPFKSKSVNRAQGVISTQKSRLTMKKPVNVVKATGTFATGGSPDFQKNHDFITNSMLAMKQERINELERSLLQGWDEERADAAKQLGTLGARQESIIESLKRSILEDDNERVQYESMKALITLDCLDVEILQILSDYLIVGNPEIRQDLLKHLGGARGVTFIKKTTPVYQELAKVLDLLCEADDPEDPVAFEAAAMFGSLQERNEKAVIRMHQYLKEGKDTHKRAMALRMLVLQFNETSWETVQEVLDQFEHSPVWEYRTEAAQLMQQLGQGHMCPDDDRQEIVYSTLERRLWDDSQEIVRLEAAKTIIILNMFTRASETVLRNLQNTNSTIRTHAVTSLATLGIKTTRVVKQLIEMLELDPSETVRRQVIRAIGTLNIMDKRAIRLLRERERNEGILGREAANVLKKFPM